MANYLDNKKLFEVYSKYIAEYKEAVKQNKPLPLIPEFIGECVILIAQNLATASNFASYTWKEEMIEDGVENCIQYLHNFDPNKSNVVINNAEGKFTKGQDVYQKINDNISASGTLYEVKAVPNSQNIILKILNTNGTFLTSNIIQSSTGKANILISRSKNPYGYLTMIIFQAFLRRIDKEKRQQYVKYKTLENEYMLDNLVHMQAGEKSIDLSQIQTDEFTVNFVETYERKLASRREKTKIRNTAKLLDKQLLEKKGE